MEVRIIFCKGHSLISKAITYFTEEPISHVALLVDGKWVVHANLRGVHVQYSGSFLEDYEVYAMSSPITTSLHLPELLTSYSHKYYDLLAILYLGIRYLIKKLFRVKLPKVNLWQTTGLFMCTEWVSYVLEGKEDSLITPYQLYLKYKDFPQ